MSEIVYTETQKYRDFIDTMEGGRRPADRKTTIFASQNKVALVNSALVVGVPRGADHVNKRYYYWRSTNSVGFYRNRAGQPQPYCARRSWDAKVAEPWRHGNAAPVFNLLGDTSTPGGQAFTHAVWEAFGASKMEEVYPIAGRYELPSYTHMPYSLRPAMRHSDWASFAAHAFGKTRATPRLVAAVENTEPYIVSLAQQFRGFVPNELLTKFIEDNHFDDEMEEGFRLHNPNVREIVRNLNEKSASAILSRGLDLGDTARIMQMTGPGGKYYRKHIEKDKDYSSWSDMCGR